MVLASVHSSAQSTSVQTDHVRAELIADAPDGLRAGGKLKLGLRLQHQPHWHSYWKNPGDSGLPTNFRWELPAGWVAGEIDWPTPAAFLVEPLMNFGYENEVLLPVTLSLPDRLDAGEFEIKLRARWLVCDEICVPESGQFALRLSSSPISLNRAAFDAVLERRPKDLDTAIAATLDGEFMRLSVNQLPAEWQKQTLQAFPEAAGVFEHAAPVEQSWKDEVWSARLALSAQRSASPNSFFLVLKSPHAQTGARIQVSVPAWSKKSS